MYKEAHISPYTVRVNLDEWIETIEKILPGLESVEFTVQVSEYNPYGLENVEYLKTISALIITRWNNAAALTYRVNEMTDSKKLDASRT